MITSESANTTDDQYVKHRDYRFEKLIDHFCDLKQRTKAQSKNIKRIIGNNLESVVDVRSELKFSTIYALLRLLF